MPALRPITLWSARQAGPKAWQRTSRKTGSGIGETGLDAALAASARAVFWLAQRPPDVYRRVAFEWINNNKHFMKLVAQTLNLLVFSMALSMTAADWPQWRGPQRNGISQETGLLKEWPKEGPKLRWKVANIGSGYSTPAVVGDQLYLLANEGVENEFVAAVAVQNCTRVWAAHLGNLGEPKKNPNFPPPRPPPTAQ